MANSLCKSLLSLGPYRTNEGASRPEREFNSECIGNLYLRFQAKGSAYVLEAHNAVHQGRIWSGAEGVAENASLACTCYVVYIFLATTAISGESGENAEPATSEKNSMAWNPFFSSSSPSESLLKYCSQL